MVKRARELANSTCDQDPGQMERTGRAGEREEFERSPQEHRKAQQDPPEASKAALRLVPVLGLAVGMYGGYHL